MHGDSGEQQDTDTQVVDDDVLQTDCADDDDRTCSFAWDLDRPPTFPGGSWARREAAKPGHTRAPRHESEASAGETTRAPASSEVRTQTGTDASEPNSEWRSAGQSSSGEAPRQSALEPARVGKAPPPPPHCGAGDGDWRPAESGGELVGPGHPAQQEQGTCADGLDEVLRLPAPGAPPAPEGACAPERADPWPRAGPPTRDCSDVRLHVTTWQSTVVASLFGALTLLGGLVVLGLGEEGRLGKERSAVVAARVLAWFILFAAPGFYNAGHLVAFLLYEIVPEGGCLAVWLSAGPLQMAAYARKCGRGSAMVARAALVFPLFHGFPFLVSLVVLSVPLEGAKQHLGLVWVYVLASILGRAVVGKQLPKLFPPGEARLRYFGTMAKSNGVCNILLLLVCTLFALLQRALGHWVSLFLPALLACYELGSVHFVTTGFSETFAMDFRARASYRTPQGICPSTFVALIHCNAEAARLALLLCSMDGEHAVAVLCTSLLATLAVNCLVRTRWQLRLLALLSRGRYCNSNTLMLLLRVKFQMGYPRFFAAAAIGVARLALGHPPMPSSLHLWAVSLLLLEEVVEDVVVSLVERAGLCSELHYAPRPTQDGTSQRAARRAWAEARPAGPRRCLCCKKHARVADQPALSSIVATVAVEEVLEGHRFRYEPQAQFLPLPLWAHLVAVLLPQLNLLMLWVFFGRGVHHVLGLCHQPSYSGYGQGLVWWPTFPDCQG